MKCVYCLEEKGESSFQHTEHVVPQAFGRFRDNLTLNRVVCDDCNQYFGDNIEIFLGRDSLEGIARYNYGIRSKSEPFYKRVKLNISSIGKLKGIHVILKKTTGTEEVELEIVSQVGFYHSVRREYDYFSEDQIPEKEELENQGYQLKNDIVFYGDIENLVKILKNKGINIKIQKIKEEIQNMEKCQIPVIVKARIDRTIFRGLSKIAFNYLSYHMGRDYALRDDFNGIRNFIRFNQGDGNNFCRITTNPILHREKKFRSRRLKGHIIVINWENFNNDLISRLSIYNAQIGLTYEFFLCRNYRGVWIQIQKGHYFDPDTRTISEMQHTNLILP